MKSTLARGGMLIMKSLPDVFDISRGSKQRDIEVTIAPSQATIWHAWAVTGKQLRQAVDTYEVVYNVYKNQLRGKPKTYTIEPGSKHRHGE
ncbi:hypothetical protein PCO31111_04175 [Pandoraea communis]|uniref:Uncharacterized protein n=1 Tax=Pandoraea communis TaxID=2508297 RepID=A0A5E4XXH4_9BURK|nr:hypothetical protein [Pandoraea communis]VVE41074.1 hypothetical protein PCO31111_04175 [Pandoraea communis]